MSRGVSDETWIERTLFRGQVPLPRESPAQRDQPPELLARDSLVRVVVADVAPCGREVQARLDLVRFAEGDVELRALVPAAMNFGLGQVLHGRVHRVDELLREGAVVLANALTSRRRSRTRSMATV
jgi:hypothetical protein